MKFVCIINIEIASMKKRSLVQCAGVEEKTDVGK